MDRRYTRTHEPIHVFSLCYGSAMNRFYKTVLSWFAAPRLSMREHYEAVRRLQRRLATFALLPPRLRSWHTAQSDSGFQVPVRIFQPKQKTRDEVLVFFHGGGWVIGDVVSYTPVCNTMADLTGCVVVSVDYRLAPEHPFPAGLEDCYQVTHRILENPGLVGAASADNIVLFGDSAGGNLAVGVSLLLRERDQRKVAGQILLYPITQYDHNPETSPFESVRQHGQDYRLTTTEVQDYLELYVPDPAQRCDPLVSPLTAEDLSNLPDTLLVTAELDLLRDEAEAFGEALANAGNTVTLHRVNKALHGFIMLPRRSGAVQQTYALVNAFLGPGTTA